VIDARRRLIWHGILLFLLGLIAGMFVQSMRNPRLGLSAHVGAAMSGMFLAILGVAWPQIRLGARAAVATFWAALYGMYVSSAGLVLGAALGTGRSTPIASAGLRAAAWQENLVDFALTSGAIAALVGCAGVLWGLGRERAPEHDGR
jgi:(hydroxyamino)benzene mutase